MTAGAKVGVDGILTLFLGVIDASSQKIESVQRF
jgi:hypothetical protein